MLCNPSDQQHNQCPRLQPTQWAMGMQPRIPGVLMDHDLTTAQLTPSEAMEQKLQLQRQAAISAIEADNDARLRRALLRQHQAVRYTYSTGPTGLLHGGCTRRSRSKNPMERSSNSSDDRARPHQPSNQHLLDHSLMGQHSFVSLENTYDPTSTSRATQTQCKEHNKHWTTSEAEAQHCTLTSSS